jgi:gamma-D-glutamyl-L-lysine dipeptidyl-peptidase
MGIVLALVMAATTGVVVQPVANMYSSPAEDTDVVSQAIYAASVGVLEQKGDWARIRTPDNYTGWTRVADLRLTDRSYAAAGRVAEVRSLFAHLYREPSVTRHAPLLTAPFEAKLEVVAEPDRDERRWIQVRLPDDRGAWVQRGDVVFSPPALSIPAMIELAKRFLGLPYTWGGTSSYGYDCSGFAQMLCRRRGILMPRDAQPQADWDGMLPVERNALAAGDLLYFGSSGRKITHTGLYIGAGQFIHATTHEHPVIQISRLDEERWTKLFVAARRPK